MLRRLFALVILIGLGLGGLYYWKYRPDMAAHAEGLGFGAARDAVSLTLQETKIKGAVKAALGLHGALAPLPLEVDAEGDTAILRGTTPSPELRAVAEQVAAGVAGVAAVRNEIRVDPSLVPPADNARSMGESLDDRALEAKVRLAYSLNRGMDGSDVNVSVYRRQVALSGTVASPAQRALALQIARDTSGVAGVLDHMVKDGAGPAETPAPAHQATPRAEAVRRALSAHESLGAYALRVREEDGHIAVSGRVKTPAERDLAAYVAREAAGTNVRTNITLLQ